MIRKIVLENYTAHVRTVIEPAQGLTVLIGPNNCGKSAIIHALEMICYNSDAADYAIRHGAKKAVVTIHCRVGGARNTHSAVWLLLRGAASMGPHRGGAEYGAGVPIYHTTLVASMGPHRGGAEYSMPGLSASLAGMLQWDRTGGARNTIINRPFATFEIVASMGPHRGGAEYVIYV